MRSASAVEQDFNHNYNKPKTRNETNHSVAAVCNGSNGVECPNLFVGSYNIRYQNNSDAKTETVGNSVARVSAASSTSNSPMYSVLRRCSIRS